MNFDRLRELILERAIQGKLVPQLESEPEVIPISELPRNLPFALPSKWKWVKLNEVTSCIAGQSPDGAFINENVGTEFHQGKQFFTDKEIGISHKKTTMVTKEVGGDTAAVVLSVRAPVGDVNIVRRKICIGRGLFGIVPKESVDVEYLFFAMSALSNFLQKQSSGTTFKAINGKTVREFHFPLPPLSEQHRITTKINRLFEQINRIEESQKELLFLSEKFRQSCLKKATQGGLVPQLENEPEVPQTRDSPEKLPFKIPGKWKWVKLGDVFHLKAGRFISSDKIKASGTYPCYGGNGKRGYVDEFNREGKFPLIGRQGALCGNINLVEGKFYATEHAVVADGRDLTDPDCATLFLEFLNLNQYATKTAQPGLSVKKIAETPYPLAPLVEQRRIASKIKKLFTSLDQLKG